MGSGRDVEKKCFRSETMRGKSSREQSMPALFIRPRRATRSATARPASKTPKRLQLPIRPSSSGTHATDSSRRLAVHRPTARTSRSQSRMESVAVALQRTRRVVVVEAIESEDGRRLSKGTAASRGNAWDRCCCFRSSCRSQSRQGKSFSTGHVCRASRIAAGVTLSIPNSRSFLLTPGPLYASTTKNDN